MGCWGASKQGPQKGHILGPNFWLVDFSRTVGLQILQNPSILIGLQCRAKFCILSQIQVGFKPIPVDTANLHHHWCTCLCASPLMFNGHSLATQQHRKQVALSARWEKEELIGVDAISSRITPQSPPHNNSSTSG